MEFIRDFEDLIALFGTHRVRYVIIGGLAFIYHARPRYTKDMDIWVDSDPQNVARANEALAEFGSPHTLDAARPNEILQLGVAPNRIDLFLHVEGTDFESVWRRRVEGRYGASSANWIDIESLIQIKSLIDHPRHQDDVRILRQVLNIRAKARDDSK